MYLDEINIKNFRNISNISIKKFKNKNIFIGKNAQGKTSILESIYFLSITKSHRTNIDCNLIKETESFAKITGKVINKENNLNKLEVLISEKGKTAKVNNEKITKLSDYISRLGIIIFSPDDIEILKGSPAIRRKNLNISISQIYKDYLNSLNIYNKVLKQRNEYLKQKKNINFNELYFDVLTNKIIELNIKIINYRKEYIENINKNINKIYKKLLGTGNIKIKYETIIKEEIDSKKLEEQIREKFRKNRQNEMTQQTTLIGIHRDDFLFMCDKNIACEYLSQGLQKIAILALKLSELIVYQEIKKDVPIVLLDDIFSEIDNNKKNRILKYFNEDTQVFITTIDIKDINNKYFKDAKIFRIKEGTINNESRRKNERTL